MPDADDPSRTLSIPAEEYPAGFVFYEMGKAGLLQGLPETVDTSSAWKPIVVDDDTRRSKFLKKYSKKLTLKFRHVPDSFGRLLAKIGYCQILTTLDLGNFNPICLPYILGERTNLSFIVGSSEGAPEPDNGYSLATAVFGSGTRLMLVARVRLYANTHAPTYHVVVGDIDGAENVKRVSQKLDTQPNDSTSSAEPWYPDVLPLPFWTRAI